MPKVQTSTPRIYLGIDPGASGGLVALGSDGGVRFRKMPKTEENIWAWIKTFGPVRVCPIHACLERVSPGFGRQGTGKVQMAKLYGHYRMLRAFLVAAGIPLYEPTATEWHRGLGISSRKKTEGKVAWKNRLKAEACRRFPGLKVTLATADALLIALYCRQYHGSTTVVPTSI